MELQKRISSMMKINRPRGQSGWDRISNDKYLYFRHLLEQHRRSRSLHWANDGGRSSSSDSSSDSESTKDSSSPMSIFDASNADACGKKTKQQRQQEKEQQQLDANNSGQGIDMLNLPSTAETIAWQKSWIVLYFRYRVKWCEAKPVLAKLSKEEAYQPENLKLWTRYVKISQHRKVPFLHSIRAFRNRIQCPNIRVRYTLNSFYRKGSENERAKNAGPLHPFPVPLFRCPDDVPEFRKMAVAVVNIFVTTDDTYFDQFWKECAEH